MPSGRVLRSGTPRLVIQEFCAWVTAIQLVRASVSASLALPTSKEQPGARGTGPPGLLSYLPQIKIHNATETSFQADTRSQ